MVLKSKLDAILYSRGMSQQELCDLVLDKTGVTVYPYQVNRMVNCSHMNVHIRTIAAIAKALELRLDDVTESLDLYIQEVGKGVRSERAHN